MKFLFKLADDKKQKIIGFVSTGLLVLAVCVCTFVLFQVSTKGYVVVAKHSVFRVVTGSMEPTIHVGALVLSKEEDIKNINKDDIICFKSKESYNMGSIITHRVVDVLKDGDGEINLSTCGDANLAVDGYFVTSDNLIGKVKWYSKKGNIMETLLGLLTDKIGFFALAVFPCLLICGIVLRKSVKNIKKEIAKVLKENEGAEVKQDLKSETSDLFVSEEEKNSMRETIKKELIRELEQAKVNDDEGSRLG